MTRIFQHGLLVVLLLSSPHSFSQSTFQQLFPGLQNSMGNNAHRSLNGGVTFATWAYDQFGMSGRDMVLISLSDQGDTLWTRTYGRPHNDQSFSMLGTADGGYLIVGGTDTSDIINPGQQLYLIRTDAFGDTLWTRAYWRSSYDYGLAATECFDGGFTIVGTSSPGGLYLVRIGAQGHLIWSRVFDKRDPPFFDSQVPTAWGVAQLVDGSFIVCGNHQSGAALVSNINSVGDLLWTRRTDIGNVVALRQIVATQDGGCLMVGPIQIDGDYDCLFVKSDSLGTIAWSRAYDCGGDESLFSIIQTTDSGFADAGYTTEAIPAPHDMYFLKTDSVGLVQFSISFGGSSVDIGQDVVEADDGGYFIVGYTKSFGYDTSMYAMKINLTDDGACYQNNISTIVTDVNLVWQDIELESFSSLLIEHSGACSVGRGATVLPLCPVGVDEVMPDKSNVQVFPNPATARITITLPSNSTRSELEVFNALGERMMASRVRSSQTMIDCSSFARGIYLVKVTTSTTTVTQRVVLE